MTAPDSPDFAALLQPLAERMPKFRAALLAQAAGDLEQVGFQRGEVLLRRGDTASAVYVIVRGRLRATAPRADGSELTLSEFGPGEMAGEMASLFGGGGGVCTATVVVAEDALLVRIPIQTFDRVMTQAPEAAHELSQGMRRRLLRDQLASGLGRLFGHLEDDVLQYLEQRVQWVRLRAGERLFEEGDSGRDLYFVLGGRLRGTTRDGRDLGEMGRGESIGEIALLTGEARSATIEAVRDSDLVRVTPQSFDEIVARYPQVMQAVARVVVQRLRSRERATTVDSPRRCIAVLAIGASLSTARFCERLVQGLGRIGSVMHLSAQRVGAQLKQPGIADSDPDQAAGIRLAAWLDEQEASTPLLVYQTDDADSPWTRRCLRQADEVLLVADAASDPVPSEREIELLGGVAISNARRTLVLLHADGSRLPSNTARWLAGRRVQQHFHVRLDRDADFERLARCLAGVAVGVVFGGGGARGLAHIGVIRALQEAQVPIDMIGGTSMGAVIAAAFGMGLDCKHILETSRVGWLQRKPHKEYTLPFVSIIRSKLLDRWVDEFYGATRIEDLWLNFFCVSCNLSKSELTVFESGSLALAVRASASLPGVFVPVLAEGNVYVDGAIFNNLPGDIMRKRSGGRMIAVDVGSDRAFDFDMQEVPSPWALLWNRLLPFTRRLDVPHIGAVLMRSTEVSSKQKALEVRRDADLCLRPPLDRFGALEFEKIDEIVEVGFRYTQGRLAQLRGEPAATGILPPARPPPVA